MNDTHYHIWFTYHRYDTGQEGGDYSRKATFHTLEEAAHAKWMIEAYIRGKLSSGNKSKLEEKYLGGWCSGFFKSFDGIYKVHSSCERMDLCTPGAS